MLLTGVDWTEDSLDPGRSAAGGWRVDWKASEERSGCAYWREARVDRRLGRRLLLDSSRARDRRGRRLQSVELSSAPILAADGGRVSLSDGFATLGDPAFGVQDSEVIPWWVVPTLAPMLLPVLIMGRRRWCDGDSPASRQVGRSSSRDRTDFVNHRRAHHIVGANSSKPTFSLRECQSSDSRADSSTRRSWS